MKTPLIFGIALMLLVFESCISKKENSDSTYPDIHVVSAMKKVMWSGELHAKINLDTISNKEGLQGIGPESYLRGELLILDGKSYISRVLSDSTMEVTESYRSSAPFFVYANVKRWKTVEIPDSVNSLEQLEFFVDQQTKYSKRPFAFKVVGKLKKGIIHIQNLPQGTKVSSPKEAHQGQVNYPLENEEVEILGFFSTEHQAIFTHHDTYMHLHLLTKDRKKMGHLDEAIFEKIELLLPIE